MLVTLSGMVMLVSLVQPEKAQSSMLVTLLGMVKEAAVFLYKIKLVLALLYNTPFSELYAGLAESTFIAVREEKAKSPMLVTLLGIVTAARLVQ
jgi:hypothetical protein